MLHWISKQVREVYNTFYFSTTIDSIKLGKTLEQFRAYFNLRKNITVSKKDSLLMIRNIKKLRKSKLRKLSSDCELEDLRELPLRDMFVMGFKDKTFRELLLS